DDIEFVRQLDDPELFGEEPSATGIGRHSDSAATEGEDIDYLRRQFVQFQNLPEARQEQLRALDRDFHDLDDETQARLRQVLERYNYWLTQLPDDERRRVESSRPGRRIEVIEELRDRDWVGTLPKAYRDKYFDVSAGPETRRHLVKEWRQEDRDRWD